ncbi:MAG: hypothetical protein M3R35_06720 [Candidatus Eremiobacteraeota bacterium]|nr:hypothetical protein [Candidatus Eremiobacteraeota bacterium]
MTTTLGVLPNKRGQRSLSGSLDIETSPESAFSLICAVEKWPVWLSFLRSAVCAEPSVPIALGTEVIVRSIIPGEAEQRYEVDQYISNHHLSLVGAFSVRRRIDFRIERKTSRAKVHVRVDYPAYHGWIGTLHDRLTAGRKLSVLLDDSLQHFKGLVEFENRSDAVLADF